MPTDEIKLITIAELSKMFGVSRTTLWRRYRNDPGFPQPMKNACGAGLRWRRDAIVDYLDKLQDQADRAAYAPRP